MMLVVESSVVYGCLSDALSTRLCLDSVLGRRVSRTY